MGFVKFVMSLILFALLVASLYLLYLNWPTEPVEYTYEEEKVNPALENIESAVSEQFYENMRFKKKKVSYKLEPNCDSEKSLEMKEAFSILERKTILSFNQDNIDPEIRVFCSEIAPGTADEGYFVAGEGGPTEVINTSLYGVILSAKISFFREEKCKTPNIALHELLHALGFDHNNNPNSILFPTLDCVQTIDESVINDINLLYSADGAADLRIAELDVVKSGRYINFDIEVVNQGLEDAGDVSLRVYEDGDFVQEFELNDVKIGTRKFLDVDNLRGKRNGKKLVFIVDEENKIPELFEGNNRAEILLS